MTTSQYIKLKNANSQKDTLLGGLFLISSGKVNELKRVLVEEGVLKGNNNWNISSILGRASKYAILKNKTHWELTDEGKSYVEETFGFNEKRQRISREIDSILERLDKSNSSYAYVTEFANCFRYGLLKASLIMAWSGAMWLLRNHVATSKLKEFNDSGKNRHSKWKSIKNVTGFEEIKDRTFLEVGRDAGIFSKSFDNKIRKILDFRNECSHPSSIDIGEVEVTNAIEFLVNNVYKKHS